MSKGRGARGREEKKPKAEKKPSVVASTFLRPQPVPGKTSVAKESKK
jgi:hypothetical protein